MKPTKHVDKSTGFANIYAPYKSCCTCGTELNGFQWSYTGPYCYTCWQFQQSWQISDGDGGWRLTIKTLPPLEFVMEG